MSVHLIHFGMFNFIIEYEELYAKYMQSVLNPIGLNPTELKESFNDYIECVFRIGEIPKARQIQLKSHFIQNKTIPETLMEKDDTIDDHPLDPVSLKNMQFIGRNTIPPSISIQGQILIKMLLSEPIPHSDLLLLTNCQKFNLQKTLFMKYKRIIDVR